jgi:AcrR family transcriptional regulator
MSKSKKRVYLSPLREEKATQTKQLILESARVLFEAEGFEKVTIEKIAKSAKVSAPTVYAIFQSKRGVLRSLMDDVFCKERFEELVEKSSKASTPYERLLYSAKIAREMYDAERVQMDVFRGVSLLSPEFKELEHEREMRRYERQEQTIKDLKNEGYLNTELSVKKARDILWAFTGRDMYRMLVIDQHWTSDEYETWLSDTLALHLVLKK